MSKQRSRAYPNENVVAAYEILTGELADIDTIPYSRKFLAEKLGYANASGGNAARKIGALAHFGFLDRSDGHYTLSAFGRYVRGLQPEGTDWQSAMSAALQRPALFRDILGKFRPTGRIPLDRLAKILEEEFDVTPRASQRAANIFLDSALVAGVLDPDGTFKNPSSQGKVTPMPVSRPSTKESLVNAIKGPATAPSTADRKHTDGEERVWNWEFPLEQGQANLHLELPSFVSEEDLNTLDQYFDFYLKIVQRAVRHGRQAL